MKVKINSPFEVVKSSARMSTIILQPPPQLPELSTRLTIKNLLPHCAINYTVVLLIAHIHRCHSNNCTCGHISRQATGTVGGRGIAEFH